MADLPQNRSRLVGLRDGDASPASAGGGTGEERDGRRGSERCVVAGGAGRATCLSEKPKHFVNVAPGEEESANTADPWDRAALCWLC